MTREALTTAAFCILEVAIAFLPWIPAVSTVLPAQPSVKDAMDTTIAMLGLHATLLVAYLGIMLSYHSLDRRRGQDSIITRLQRGPVRQLRDDDFYTDFLREAKMASSHVYISYFAPYPPHEIRSTDRKRYYEDMLKLARRMKHVKFRRLVRDTPANRKWLRKLIKDLDGKHNMDLALIVDAQTSEMPLCLSVQVIDGRLAWLVATQSHEREGEFRDLFIDDALISREFTYYHERLWELGTRIVEAGRITDHGRSILEESTSATNQVS